MRAGPGGRPAKPVNLALQGGGASGACTWDVLDFLLEDGRISFEAISGTSAGAMNAVAMADGMVKGGPEGAREALERFWRAVSRLAGGGRALPAGGGTFGFPRSPLTAWFDLWTRMLSPYEFNPLDINPLRRLVEEQIDFERVHACDMIKLFVSATNVHTGRVRVFEAGEITSQVVMASACLPHLFRAVEIDGVPYWDGGYMGNPVLYPFFYACESEDILLVQINPIERQGTPRTAREIQDRVNEITFNASLMKELRAIHFVRELIDRGVLEHKHYKRVRLHRIDADGHMGDLTASSRLDADWSFLRELRDAGRAAAGAWLDDNAAQVGKESTVDLERMFGEA